MSVRRVKELSGRPVVVVPGGDNICVVLLPKCYWPRDVWWKWQADQHPNPEKEWEAETGLTIGFALSSKVGTPADQDLARALRAWTPAVPVAERRP